MTIVDVYSEIVPVKKPVLTGHVLLSERHYDPLTIRKQIPGTIKTILGKMEDAYGIVVEVDQYHNGLTTHLITPEKSKLNEDIKDDDLDDITTAFFNEYLDCIIRGDEKRSMFWDYDDSLDVNALNLAFRLEEENNLNELKNFVEDIQRTLLNAAGYKDYTLSSSEQEGVITVDVKFFEPSYTI